MACAELVRSCPLLPVHAAVPTVRAAPRPGVAWAAAYCTGGSGSVVAGLSSTVSNGCGCGSAGCGSVPVVVGCPGPVVAGCAATGCEAVPVPRAARAPAVASSSSSRQLTIAVDEHGRAPCQENGCQDVWNMW